jgi:hypothetical protein
MREQKPNRFQPASYSKKPPAPSHSPTSEQHGWDAYRKWLSRVSTKPAERTPLDQSIYSWRGYNSWADKIRQSWKAS